MSEMRETVLNFLKVFGLVLLAFIGGLAARPFLEEFRAGYEQGYEAARQSNSSTDPDETRDEDTADIQP